MGKNMVVKIYKSNYVTVHEKPQRSPLRLRFYTSTLESASYAIGIVIYETLYLRFNCENMEQLSVY